MAAIVYLDVDDEITSAAARIRAGTEGRVALVVPSGSRLATSRINFRLLAREAQIRDRRLSIVAGDAATRALAASAGLPVFGSVAEYQDALDGPPPAIGDSPPKAGRKARPVATAAAAVAAAAAVPPPVPTVIESGGTPQDLEATQVLTIPIQSPAPARAPSIPVAGRRRWLPVEGLPAFERTNAVIAAGVLGLVVVVVAIGAWLLLPSASIVVTAREEVVGPVNVTIRADPTTDAPDADARVVPAARLTFELSATDTFPATDKRIEQTSASGIVTFTSTNTFIQVTVPRGTRVSTDSGIAFVTTRAVTVPRASFVTGPARRDVPVGAVSPGPSGNVEAGTITREPESIGRLLVTVNNADPTTGGTSAEFPRIAQADVDAAVEQLKTQLGTDFEALLNDPSRTPAGHTLFRETRSISEPVPSVDPATLVGQEVATFDLSLTSTGAVIAVDTTPVEAIAESRIRARVSADHRLIESSIETEIGDAIILGESVSFPVTVRAAQIRVLDANALREDIKGRALDEARAILEEFGEVDLTVWPDWVATIPTIDARLQLSVAPGGPSPEPPRPSGSVAP